MATPPAHAPLAAKQDETDPAEKLMLVSKVNYCTNKAKIRRLTVKGLPPFIKWALSANENYREEMEIWPCNDYTRRSESAEMTLR